MLEISEGLTDAAAWAVIVGFVQPLVLNLLLQSKWSARTQSILAFIFSILTGGLTAYFAGAFENVTSVVSIILLVAVVSIASYKGFWRPITPGLKDATSVNSDGAHEITDVR